MKLHNFCLNSPIHNPIVLTNERKTDMKSRKGGTNLRGMVFQRFYIHWDINKQPRMFRSCFRNRNIFTLRDQTMLTFWVVYLYYVLHFDVNFFSFFYSRLSKTNSVHENTRQKRNTKKEEITTAMGVDYQGHFPLEEV